MPTYKAAIVARKAHQNGAHNQIRGIVYPTREDCVLPSGPSGCGSNLYMSNRIPYGANVAEFMLADPLPVAAPKKRISISAAKAKGRNLQQKVVAKLLVLFPTLEPDDIRSTSMGASGEDVQLSPAARRLFPYNVECKKRAAHGVYAFYDQAAAGKSHEPLVVIEADRRKPLALVDLDHFLSLVSNAKKFAPE